MAVFKLPKDFRHPTFPTELGNSDNLYKGQEIYIIGNANEDGINLRGGVISMLTSPKSLCARKKKDYKVGDEVCSSDFVYSSHIHFGDSGYAIVDALTFKLLGLQKERVHSTQFPVGVRINEFKPYLK